MFLRSPPGVAIGGSQTVLLGHTALLLVVPVVGADGHCVVQMARRQVVGGPALQQTKVRIYVDFFLLQISIGLYIGD